MIQPNFRESVLAAREKLAEGREKLRRQHEAGSPGSQVCAHLTDLLDTVVTDLYLAALDDLQTAGSGDLAEQVALAPHGGYGRRELAPYSDVDLMLLYEPAAALHVQPLARRMVQDIGDAGLKLGFAPRTPAQACSLAFREPKIFTSQVESRLLTGSAELFEKFLQRFRRMAKRWSQSLMTALERARAEERQRYGDTVYLLEPNLKCSRGGLRDIQLVRWAGFARYGETDPGNLERAGVLSRADRDALREAREFLLQLRNETHFHAGRAHDRLDLSLQVELAQRFGYEKRDGVLSVERFMRDYFRHCSQVRDVARNFVAAAHRKRGLGELARSLASHQVEGDFRVTPVHLTTTRRGLAKVTSDLAETLRMMDLASSYGKPIDNATWRAVRDSMAKRAEAALSDEAATRFRSLMSQTSKLADMLRNLHQLRVLEQFIAGFDHVRCLIQFNRYHKYTIDEHSIRTVEEMTSFIQDQGPLGEAYRGIKNKTVLHLAALIHDVGKGYDEDHSIVGERLAEETAARLRLSRHDAETLAFLVRHHLKLSHLAFWRHTDDESVILQLAAEIGTPENLQLLYVLTAADLAAVGPGMLTLWKTDVLTELYNRARRHLAGDETTLAASQRLSARRQALRAEFEDDADKAWYHTQIDALPTSYISGDSTEETAADLRRLRDLKPHDAVAWARVLPQRDVIEVTVAAFEELTPGIFHKLTGALTSQGLSILSAEINTLAGGLVLDRFLVRDLDSHEGPAQAERLDEVCRRVTDSLKNADSTPAFRERWRGRQGEIDPSLRPAPTQVRIDNSTSERFTIIDVFAHDRLGLLYTITRRLFELGLSVGIAKIGTHLDQVVDVFYVTDQQGQKITDEGWLEHLRAELLAAAQDENEAADEAG